MNREKVLFSPIGHSDPINAGHDGSWIHCCRQFRPDETIIYLSSEMVAHEQKDRRFSETLRLLCEFTGHEIALKLEERPNLKAPQLFDSYYDDFEKVLTDMHRSHPEAEILVNVSSGTPAMKGCLIHLYHMLSFPVTLIQVDGPHSEMSDAMGRREAVGHEYDVSDAWANNLDNLEDAENRCHILKDEQQAYRLRAMQIRTLIEHNEFYAASLLAEELGSFLPEEVKSSLMAAADRQQLNLYAAAMKLRGFSGAVNLQKHKSELLYQAAEMVLTMQCDLDRDDIAGCVRKLTPVLFSIIIAYMNQLGIDVTKFVDKDYRVINTAKLKEAYPDFYNLTSDIIDYSYSKTLSHDLLIRLIKKMISRPGCDQSVFDRIQSLREIERQVRNDIAHKPEKMTEAIFEKRTQKKLCEMMAEIRQLFEKMDPKLFSSNFWNSYDAMKKYLMEQMQRV